MGRRDGGRKEGGDGEKEQRAGRVARSAQRAAADAAAHVRAPCEGIGLSCGRQHAPTLGPGPARPGGGWDGIQTAVAERNSVRYFSWFGEVTRGMV